MFLRTVLMVLQFYEILLYHLGDKVEDRIYNETAFPKKKYFK